MSHWRGASKMSYVEDGLVALAQAIKDYGIESIAIPALGCGYGGLDWDDVKPRIVSHLGDLQDVEIVVFAP
ncbi:MAG: macro domain-containing protein [Marinosulfonomonas sp.]